MDKPAVEEKFLKTTEETEIERISVIDEIYTDFIEGTEWEPDK